MIGGEKRQAGPGILFTVIAVLLLVLNFKLIVDDPKINYDDLSLITPLKDLSSLSQYTAKIKNGEILDIQPLRDLSLFANIKLDKLIGRIPKEITD